MSGWLASRFLRASSWVETWVTREAIGEAEVRGRVQSSPGGGGAYHPTVS